MVTGHAGGTMTSPAGLRVEGLTLQGAGWC